MLFCDTVLQTKEIVKEELPTEVKFRSKEKYESNILCHLYLPYLYKINQRVGC